MAKLNDDSVDSLLAEEAKSPEPNTVSSCHVISGARQHAELVGALRAMLDGADTARLAVGYFFVEGISSLLEPLDDLDRIDLLIGNVVNRLTEEQMREMGHTPGALKASMMSDSEFAARYRAERDQSATETALNLRRTLASLPRTEANRDTILALAHWIAQGKLHVRVSTRSRLHAKVALVGYGSADNRAPGGAIVGSSNITLSDTESQSATGLSNLDFLLEGESNYRTLNHWFEQHWSDAQDFHRELFHELGQSWHLSEH